MKTKPTLGNDRQVGDSDDSKRRDLESVISAWEAGEVPDAAALIETDPSFAADRSLVIELAYTEFRLRRKRGERLSAAAFCRRFPIVEYSLRQCLNCYSLLSSQAGFADDESAFDWPRTGRNIAGFSILEELGRGAFSRVYLAGQPAIGDRLVAIKASPGRGDEANILGRLSHPNIVPLYSVHDCEAEGIFLLCMPHRGRATLADALDEAISSGHNELTGGIFRNAAVVRGDDRPADERPVKPARGGSYVDSVLRIGLAIADALSHAHSCGILHLDVKPSNILLAFDGMPLLVDFNLSTDERELRSRIGGTLPYMAPEALLPLANSKEPREPLDGKADVYSLGVLLYQLLSLNLPYEVDDFDVPLAAVASMQVRRIDWEPPALQLPGIAIDERTRILVRRMLAFDPKKRPTAGEAKKALQRCLSHSARLRRYVGARRVGTCTSALILTSLIILPFLAFGLGWGEQSGVFEGLRSSANATPLVEGRPRTVAEKLIQARLLAANNDFEKALRSFEELESSEKRLDALAGACYCACRLKRFPQAIQAGKAYSDAGGTDVGVLNNLGYALRNEREYAEADRVLNAAYDAKSPALDVVLFNRAYIDIAQPHSRNAPINPRAISDLKELAARDVKSGECYFWLAGFLMNETAYQASHKEEILELLRTAVRYGTSSKTILTLSPFSGAITREDLQKIAAGEAEKGRSFNFDPLVPPSP